MNALLSSHKKTLALALTACAMLLGFQNCAKPITSVSDANGTDLVQISGKPSITGKFAVTAWEGNLCAESSAEICTMIYGSADLTSQEYTISISDEGAFVVSLADGSTALAGKIATSSLSEQQKDLFSFLDDSSEAIAVAIERNANALNGMEAVVQNAKYLTRNSNTGEVVLHTMHGNHLTLRPSH